jgi:hypothetical protein
VEKESTMTAKPPERGCHTCGFCGFDIEDGPYCVEPVVSKGMPFGVLLHCKVVAQKCPAPEHPRYKKREESHA